MPGLRDRVEHLGREELRDRRADLAVGAERRSYASPFAPQPFAASSSFASSLRESSFGTREVAHGVRVREHPELASRA